MLYMIVLFLLLSQTGSTRNKLIFPLFLNSIFFFFLGFLTKRLTVVITDDKLNTSATLDSQVLQFVFSQFLL
jgi:hypothetical protein